MAEQDVPVEPVEPAEPAGQASEWSFEWWGLLPLLLIVVVAIVGWRSIGSGSDGGSVAEAPVVTTVPVATTTAAAVTTSTVTSTTTPRSTSTTSNPPTGPTVNITGEMKPCRFGDDCLVASFTIDGFDDPPETFTCIYPNSEREFSFRDGGKEDACITADEGDTITIEVGGVASRTISEEQLEGE